jgi:hypothetical protein
MFLGLCIVLVSIWFGFECLDIVIPHLLDPLALVAVSVPVGFTLVSWIFLFLRFFTPIKRFHGTFVTLFLTAASLWMRAFASRPERRMRARRGEFIGMICAVTILFFFLVDKSILKDSIGSSGTVFSDLPFHLSLISSFAYGANSYRSDMVTPFYFGERLSYPIIPDFFSAILVACGGAPLRVSVALPTMLLLLSLVILLHSLASFFSSRRFAPEFTVFCFFMASGIGWRYLFLQECRDDPNANMAHCFCHGVFTFWIHPLIHFLLPQRSALFSMPIVITITLLLLHAVGSGSKDRRSLCAAGALMGLLSMISAHSFLAIGEYALLLCALHFPWRCRAEWAERLSFWAHFGGCALAVGLPQVFWLLRVHRIGFMQISPIWLETFPRSFKVFQLWWDSLGSFVVIALLIAWASLTSRQAAAYAPAVGVFLISNFIRYQPGAMDNNKVFFAAWYPLACCAVAHFVMWMAVNGNALANVVTVFAIFLFSLSSLVTIQKALHYRFDLFTSPEKDFGEWVMRNTLKDSVFLGSMWHSNPAMSVGGRLVTMGYGGWVWTHGLNVTARQVLMHRLTADIENATAFNEFKIRYAIAHTEDSEHGFRFPTPPAESRWIAILEIQSARIYRILQT